MVLCCFWETSQASGKRFSSQQGGTDRTKERGLGSKRDRKHNQRRVAKLQPGHGKAASSRQHGHSSPVAVSEVNMRV